MPEIHSNCVARQFPSLQPCHVRMFTFQMKDPLSPPIFVFSCPLFLRLVSAPSILIQPHISHFSSPSQPDSQTDLPICSDFSKNTPCTPALSENEIPPPSPPRTTPQRTLLSLRFSRAQAAHSAKVQKVSIPLAPHDHISSHYASTFILKYISFVSHAIWQYH